MLTEQEIQKLKELRRLRLEMYEIQRQEKLLAEEVKDIFSKNNITSHDIDDENYFFMTESETQKFDSKSFQLANPELYFQFCVPKTTRYLKMRRKAQEPQKEPMIQYYMSEPKPVQTRLSDEEIFAKLNEAASTYIPETDIEKDMLQFFS